MKVRRATLAVAFIAAVAVPTPIAVHYGTGTADAAETTNSVIGPGGMGKLLSDKPIANLDPTLASVSARADRITYRSRSLDGRDIVVSGALLTPKGRAPRGGWPVVSWGHGSTGTNDKCAPSTALNADGKVDLEGYSGFVAELLRGGYAVAATDYEGLGEPGVHPYIVADSEARGMIDAVRGAIQADPKLSTEWFSVGHSQGGQAAIAAGELSTTWGKGLDFRGTVGLAPVTNVGDIYGWGSPDPVNRGFYLLALRGLKTIHPGLQYNQYLGSQALKLLPKAEKECSAQIFAEFDRNFGNRLSDYQFTPQTTAAYLQLVPWLAAQSEPRGKTPGPMLLLQGDKDPSIKIPETEQAVRNARAAGTPAEFRVYPGKDHYSVLTPRSEGGAATDVVEWLNSHLRR
jgi:pimeloyl-ACP methyl ester carboxylesterase